MTVQISAAQAAELGPAAPCQPAKLPERKSASAGDDAPPVRSVIVLNLDKPDWIGVELKDTRGRPVPNEPFLVHIAGMDAPVQGTLDALGRARIEGLDPGTATIEFPRLHRKVFK